jgi:hypothetical protein
MKLSLLDMTQRILSALDSDPVSSIDETVEAVQVAEIIRDSFFDLMSQRSWPFLRTLSTLTGLGDVNNPTKLLIPENINKMFWVKVNKKDVQYIDPAEFQHIVDTRTPELDEANSEGFVINRDPIYWTSFDDKSVIFDGWDSSATNTITSQMTSIYGVKVATWQHVDSFIPELPEKFFPTLLAEAKAQAFVNLKQQANPREEAKARRGRVTMQNEAWRNEQGEIKYNRRVNYGR